MLAEAAVARGEGYGLGLKLGSRLWCVGGIASYGRTHTYLCEYGLGLEGGRRMATRRRHVAQEYEYAKKIN